MLERTSAEETGEGGGSSHLELFDRFAAAMDAPSVPATPATRRASVTQPLPRK